jgi:hypothetical protein
VAHTVAHTHQTQQRTRVLLLYNRIIKETQAMSSFLLGTVVGLIMMLRMRDSRGESNKGWGSVTSSYRFEHVIDRKITITWLLCCFKLCIGTQPVF